MTWLRTLWAIDLLGAIFVMLEAEVQDNKLLGGVGFIFLLLCLMMWRKLKNEEEAS